MRKLFVFGDSFSNSWERMVMYNKNFYQAIYAGEYYDVNKKYPNHFQDVIKQKFNLRSVENLGLNGVDNYTIMEQLGNHMHLIEKDDLVLIGWSDITRWRHIDINKWNLNYLGDGEFNQNPYNSIKKTSRKKIYKRIQFLEKQSVMRNSSTCLEEVRSWQNIINRALNNVIFWSPFFYDGLQNVPFIQRKPPTFTISEETKGKIIDNHWSGIGHEQVGNWLCTKIKNKNSIL